LVLCLLGVLRNLSLLIAAKDLSFAVKNTRSARCHKRASR
jgi:hypothetical protein